MVAVPISLDIDPFVMGIVRESEYRQVYPLCPYGRLDCNGDGFVDFFDVDAFVELLLSE
jgi:hypothetical protein